MKNKKTIKDTIDSNNRSVEALKKKVIEGKESNKELKLSVLEIMFSGTKHKLKLTSMNGGGIFSENSFPPKNK